jgi:4-amino-4-deoxy-L-arabinose transferase-like glycosyltransferase
VASERGEAAERVSPGIGKVTEQISKDWKTSARLGRGALVALVVLLGLAVRLYRLGEAPRDFWTIRQYYNALSARALFFKDNPDIPAWRKEVIAEHRIWLAEPPLLEWVVSRIYRAVGDERFWAYRLFTISAWLLAAFGVFATARRFLGFWPALTAMAYFLFVPYGITASRSWQPDPLMVFGVSATMLAVWQYFEQPSARRLVIAGLTAAVATFFKPGGSVLTLLAIFGFLSLHEFGWRRTVLPGPFWIFALLMLIPPAAVVMFSAWMGWYQPGSHFLTYWAPHLIGTFFFWKGWLGILIKVLTLPGLMAALVGGLLLMPAGRARALVFGYATGYFAFSLICSFTTPNHDYWHLQIMPLAALCVGAFSAPVWQGIESPDRWRAVRCAVVCGVGIAWILLGLERAPWLRDRGSLPEAYAVLAREIGEAVGHSRKVIYLDYDFGTPLRYYAEISGWFWPQTEAMLYDRQTRKDRKSDGSPQWNTLGLPAAERFRLFYADKEPDFFVVCRLLKELDLQPGLREFLEQFPVVCRGERYVIYDLRNRAAK